MKHEVKESKLLESGEYVGVIIDKRYTEYGTGSDGDKYVYVDFIIETEGLQLKLGVPSNVSVRSKLGKLFVLAGVELKPQLIVEDDIFIGRKIKFYVKKEKKDGNEFSNILFDSIVFIS